MAEDMAETTRDDEVPTAVVTHRRSISIVWLVPLVAALVGGWLVYRAITERGVSITIQFESAEGLEAGKTKIRFKDVEVGLVTAIDLDPDLDHILVTAQIRKGAEPFLTDNTRFWVVRARLTAGEVSGISTLFSGAYIGMHPGKEGQPRREFQGLETPPIVTAGLPGRHFNLRASQLGGLDIGSPVYFRQVKVGQVVAHQLDDAGENLAIRIFVNAPYHQFVHRNSAFWNAGGLDVRLGVEGLDIDMASLSALLIGGVAFETPDGIAPSPPAEEGAAFRLHRRYAEVLLGQYDEKVRYLIHFDDSVRGLSVGAPVEFRGIRIGQVIDFRLEFNEDLKRFRIPVTIELEPGRIYFTGQASGTYQKNIEEFVSKGLRAQLAMGNLLTGKIYVKLDFFAEAPPAAIDYSGIYPQLPAMPAPMERMTASLENILRRLDKLPIESIGANAQASLAGFNRLMNAPEILEAVQNLNRTLAELQQFAAGLNNEAVPGINASLGQIRSTLAELQHTLSGDSALQHDLQNTLAELARASRAVRELVELLERQPNALIFGKEADK
jgi:paraquat-inducible protein B